MEGFGYPCPNRCTSYVITPRQATAVMQFLERGPAGAITAAGGMKPIMIA